MEHFWLGSLRLKETKPSFDRTFDISMDEDDQDLPRALQKSQHLIQEYQHRIHQLEQELEEAKACNIRQNIEIDELKKLIFTSPYKQKPEEADIKSHTETTKDETHHDEINDENKVSPSSSWLNLPFLNLFVDTKQHSASEVPLQLDEFSDCKSISGDDKDQCNWSGSRISSNTALSVDGDHNNETNSNNEDDTSSNDYCEEMTAISSLSAGTARPSKRRLGLLRRLASGKIPEEVVLVENKRLAI